MRKIAILPVIFLMQFAVYSIAAEQKDAGIINQPHREAGLECADCNGAKVPEKRAAASACIECHTKKSDDKHVEFNDGDRSVSVNPHNSHVGEIRCTQCHKIHRQSLLYCNEGCHHKFINTVP